MNMPLCELRHIRLGARSKLPLPTEHSAFTTINGKYSVNLRTPQNFYVNVKEWRFCYCKRFH